MNICSRCSAVLMALLVLVGCAEQGSKSVSDAPDRAAVQEVRIGDLERIHSVGDLYIASQPSEADLETFRDRGVKTVINLRPPAETPDMNEQQIVEELGMQYVNLPLSGPAQANEAFFTTAREQLRSVERPALLHCSSANRAGTAWLTYRVLDDGVGVEQALDEARRVGMRSPKLEERALEYIRKNQ